MKLGELAEAKTLLRGAVDLDAKSAKPRVALAQALFQLGDDEGGAAELDRALRLDPQNVAARTMLARMRNKAGDTEGAAAELEAVLRVDPDQPKALRRLTKLHVRQGDTDGAARVMENALAERPGDMRLLVGLSKLRAQAGEHGLAEAALRGALEGRPHSLSTKLRLVDTLLAQGKLDEARDLLDSLPARGRVQAHVLAGWGRLHLAQGQPRQAAESFRAALLRGEGGEAKVAAVEAATATDWPALAAAFQYSLAEALAKPRRKARAG
ncbi:MAG: tetratricopeptide repeat protein [Alphaproteobacteria bacterium]|nr:tetratricopeptide repeat protein [Alphaproteobacteria bacterium]